MDPVNVYKLQLVSLVTRKWTIFHWTVIVSCILLFAVVVYAIRRRNAMTAAYRKVAEEDEVAVEKGGGDGDDGYHWPGGVQSTNSRTRRRHLPVK
jgi:cbb3-type cytochrome oxidase subunit 3